MGNTAIESVCAKLDCVNYILRVSVEMISSAITDQSSSNDNFFSFDNIRHNIYSNPVDVNTIRLQKLYSKQ